MFRNPLRTTIATAVTAASALTFAPMATSPAQAASCGGGFVAPPAHAWDEQKSNCGVLGSEGHRVTYTWWVGGNGNGKACFEGWGYDEMNPDGRWFSLGCGLKGGWRVPWGNVAAVPKVRAQGMFGFIGVQWRH